MPTKPSSRTIIAAIRKELPKPIRKADDDDALVLVAGDPGEVVVHISEESLTVFEFAVEWVGPHEPEVREIPIGRLEWAQLPKGAAIEAALSLVKAARSSRLAKFKKCRLCGDMTPPEWMTGEKNVCDACAESKLGIVH
jgi:hypothetical protein